MSTKAPAAALAFSIALLAGTTAHAQALLGPAGKGTYLTLHSDLMRDYGGIDGGLGGAFEWGSFQNKFLASGMIISFDRAGPGTKLPETLYLGGGFAAHFAIGKHFLIMPEVNLGYQLTDSASGFGGNIAAFVMLGVAYRFRMMYVGLEAQRPIYEVLPNAISDFFPNLTSGGLFAGIYI